MAEITVIIPVYQVEKYINRCLDSILAQTFKDYELLLVDDGSTDQSGAICDQYALKDSRIKVFHTENRGQASARNYALDWMNEHSNSQFVTFVDSDDWIHPEYLELLSGALKATKTNISQCLYCKTEHIQDYPTTNKEIICITAKEQYLNWYNAFMCAKMYSTNIFKTVRFPDGKIYEDVAIWYKILFSQEQLSLVKDELYYYFYNPNSTVHSSWTPRRMAQIDVWDEQLKFFLDYGDSLLIKSAFERHSFVYQHQCDEIKLSTAIPENEKKQYEKDIIKRWKSILRNNKVQLKEAGLYSRLYDLLHPKLAWLRWTAIGLFNKFRSGDKNDS